MSHTVTNDVTHGDGWWHTQWWMMTPTVTNNATHTHRVTSDAKHSATTMPHIQLPMMPSTVHQWGHIYTHQWCLTQYTPDVTHTQWSVMPNPIHQWYHTQWRMTSHTVTNGRITQRPIMPHTVTDMSHTVTDDVAHIGQWWQTQGTKDATHILLT